jgi:DNA-binding IclR family transcriptional regulator
MNNPGTKLALQIIKILLIERQKSIKTFYPTDFPDSDGKPLFSPSTLLRTLKLLEDESWIHHDQQGSLVFSESIKTLLCSYSSSFSTTAHVTPFVKELAQSSGESAAFAVWHEDGITFSATYEMADSFHYIPIGEKNRHNLHNGFNITCMAYLERKQREELFNRPQELSLIPNLKELEQISSQIRKTEIFFWEDIAKRITAPVFYPGKLLAGVIGISYFNRAYTKNDIATLRQQVSDSAHHITRMLQ